MKSAADNASYSPWPHRWAVALCCAVFPLIWVGALVTTYSAGMAVPDWPTTYGYNMFLYPWQTWILGPFDLFVEHGHRLLGSLAGMLTIALVVAVFWSGQGRMLKVLSVVALVAVIAQGVLGGMRVLLDARSLALIHGCTGPLFFAYCCVLAVITSRRWQAPGAQRSGDPSIFAASLLTVALAFVQLVFGATLRHMPVDAEPGVFRAAVLFHVVMAFLVALQIGMLTTRVFRFHADERWLRRPALGLALLISIQLLLGMTTWVMKYSFPAALHGIGFAAGYTVTASSLSQSLVVTAHVAVGSLILATGAVLAVRAGRICKSAAISLLVDLRTRGLAA